MKSKTPGTPQEPDFFARLLEASNEGVKELNDQTDRLERVGT